MSGEAITPDDLAYARSTQQEALHGSAARYQRVSARDSHGGMTDAWGAVPGQSAVPCRVTPAGQDAIQEYADQLQGNDASVLTLPFGTASNYRDHWVVAGDAVYEVVAPAYGGTTATALRQLVVRV